MLDDSIVNECSMVLIELMPWYKGNFFFIRFLVHTQFEASDPWTNGISSPYKEVEDTQSVREWVALSILAIKIIKLMVYPVALCQTKLSSQ